MPYSKSGQDGVLGREAKGKEQADKLAKKGEPAHLWDRTTTKCTGVYANNLELQKWIEK